MSSSCSRIVWIEANLWEEFVVYSLLINVQITWCLVFLLGLLPYFLHYHFHGYEIGSFFSLFSSKEKNKKLKTEKQIQVPLPPGSYPQMYDS